MISLCSIALACLFAALGPTASAQNTVDWMTGAPREEIAVKEWPGGKKVAVCFVFFCEEWGNGRGPNFRPDMIERRPDFVNEAFRQYAINEGILRVMRLFRSENLPLSIALNATFPERFPEVWKELRATQPEAVFLGHGFNNSNDLLPIGLGETQQRSYVRNCLDVMAKHTGKLARGWSSPSVYFDQDTFAATAAEGISYSLDAMDSDHVSRLKTKNGNIVLIPYPPVSVDMGQFLYRYKSPQDLEKLWTDYVSELVKEAQENPQADATIVSFGIHPFVVGTPDGAAALRRVLDNLKKQNMIWVADLEQVLGALPK